MLDFIFVFLQDGHTALHLAAYSEYEGKEKMAALLDKGADCNVQDKVGTSSLSKYCILGKSVR